MRYVKYQASQAASFIIDGPCRKYIYAFGWLTLEKKFNAPDIHNMRNKNWLIHAK